MTRFRLIKAIMEETGYDKETVSNVIESLEYKILDTIAMEDQLDFVFGSIYGITKPSHKITGYVSMLPEIRKQKAWSSAFLGYPMIKFSREAKNCDRVYANEFFAWPENRYTSLARNYRQDVGDPEIPEYEGLSEEKIQELCKKADEEKKGPQSPHQKAREASNERKRIKHQEARHALMRQMDLEKQRENGVAEEDLIERPFEDILEDMKAEWWQTHEDFQKNWKPYLADPEKVKERQAARLQHAKEHKEWMKRQAELKNKRNEVWQGEINDDGIAVEKNDG